MSQSAKAPERLTYAQYFVEVPFLDHLKIFVEPSDGAPYLVVDLERMHMNGGFNAHGGLVMTLLDMAMAAAIREAHPQKIGGVTVEMKTTLMRPGGKVGDQLRARGFVRHSTKSLAFCEGELHNGDGELVATASGTFKYVNRYVTTVNTDAP